MWLCTVLFTLITFSQPIVIYAASLDPVRNFCVRFDHQSVVANGKLYIYGGEETFAPSQNGGSQNGTVTFGTSNYLIEVDVTRSWDWKANVSETTRNITVNPSTGSLPPQVVRGALYQGPAGDGIYLYGGTTSYLNTSFPGRLSATPASYSLWSWNFATQEWSQYDVSADAPYRPSNGAFTDASDQGLAYWFNGELDQGSSSATQFLGPSVTISLPGMIVINMTTHSAKNLSTSAVGGGQPRTRGRMQYVGGIGGKGVVFLIGGSFSTTADLGTSNNGYLASMSEINVFDVSSLYEPTTPDGLWYKQTAVGQNATGVPSPRVDFCLVAVSAPDMTSHHLYMYGGRDLSNNYYDEVWVLSLPAFVWSRVYAGESPRFSHTCHLVSNRTMLTVGGVNNVDQMRGSGSQACDWEEKSVGILDMSGVIWGSVYNAHAPMYEVPSQLFPVTGGSSSGNATIKQLVNGFSDQGLGKLFGIAPTDSTLDGKTKSDRTALIAGTVCGVVGFEIFSTIIWFIIRQIKQNPDPSDEPVYEKDVVPDRSDAPVVASQPNGNVA